jgi:flagellar biosynthesis protein FlhB
MTDLLSQILKNPIMQMILSAAVSWMFNRIVDPLRPADMREPQNHQTSDVARNSPTERGATPTEVKQAVEDALRRNQRLSRNSQEDGGIAMVASLVILGIGAWLVMRYGTVVVDVVRYIVFFTGFSVAFSMFHSYRTGLFQERLWAVKTAVILVVCVLCFLAADAAKINIEVSTMEAQRNGWRLTTMGDFLKVFGFRGLYQLVTLAIVVMVSALSLLAQVNMVLNAYSARNLSAHDWRMKLLRTMGQRWSSAINLGIMVAFSIAALGFAAGWFRAYLGY